MSLLRRSARAMLAASFVAGGIDQLRDPTSKAGPAEAVTGPLAERVPQLPNDPEQLVKLDGVIKVVGGIGLVFGPFARPAALLLAGSMLPTTLAGHRFWETTDPDKKVDDKIEFFKNISLIGGLLVTALDTGSRPSVGWRARNAADLAGDRVEGSAAALKGAAVGTAGALAGAAGRAKGAAAETAGKAKGTVAETAGKAKGAAVGTGGALVGAAGKAKGTSAGSAGLLADIAGRAKGVAGETAGRAKGAAAGTADKARGAAGLLSR